ncbi:MAG: hypothetical protein SCARUB_04952 [Candidatus Scalindua rubra]|uniref:Phage Mu protein F like protein n=1 Tax=Candidatus Scalindua rubra TaxID=1872076 RepID=A0A1E3X2V7_9BACT|nr:MAG: hypothetical protein SCARUB_04952 [Candidatus Scalindua rubra]
MKLREKLMTAKKPESVKRIAPWRNAVSVRGKRMGKLPLGMSLPPYHFNCRTITVAVEQGEKEVLQKDQRDNPQDYRKVEIEKKDKTD